MCGLLLTNYGNIRGHMRPNTNKRSRGRNNNNNNNRRNTNNRSQVFDSNGPEVRIRGTAFQVNEKYMALAKDASSSGDLVLAESYLQHAEHYQRMINSWNKEDEDQAKEKAEKEPKKAEAQSKEDELALPESILTPTSSKKEAMQDA